MYSASGVKSKPYSIDLQSNCDEILVVEMDVFSPHISARSNSPQLVVFCLEEQRYALRLCAVEQIVRMVEITPLPKAPEIILGIVNIRGRIVPVFHIRKRFHLSERDIGLSDHLIVARTARRTVALAADAVIGVLARADEEMAAPERIFPGLEYVEGVVKLDDGLVFIHDLDTFLSLEEEKTMEQALATA
jgi:purine-binding chemotaxis protein CheW